MLAGTCTPEHDWGTWGSSGDPQAADMMVSGCHSLVGKVTLLMSFLIKLTLVTLF